MDRLTKLLGKPILTKSGIKVGTVAAVQLDKQLKKLKNIGYNTGEIVHFFPCSAIFAHDKDAIILKNSTALPCKNCITIPIGIAVYTVLGEYVGKLVDFQLDNFDILYALLEEDKQLPLSQCIGITDSIIIDIEGKEKKQIGNPVRKQNTTKQTTAKRTKQKDTTSVEQKQLQEGDQNQTENIDFEQPLTMEYDELIERKQSLSENTSNANNIDNSSAHPVLENTSTAQIVVPPKMEYVSNAQNIKIKQNSLEFRPISANATQTAQSQAKNLQEIYATQQFLQQANKEVGTKVLTGKRLTADLMDELGNVLIEKYTVIAPEHIKKAMENNKLFQLIQLLNNF